MENFIDALTKAIDSFSDLGKEWEKIEADYSDKLSEGYPFSKDFMAIISDMIEWKEKLQE